jgi:hypothetical protein
MPASHIFLLFAVSFLLQGCLGMTLAPNLDLNKPAKLTSDFKSGQTYTARLGDVVYREADSSETNGAILRKGLDRYTGNGDFRIAENTELVEETIAATGQKIFCTKTIGVYGFFNMELGPACFQDADNNGEFDAVYMKAWQHGRVWARGVVSLKEPLPYELAKVPLTLIGLEYVVTFNGKNDGSFDFWTEMRDHQTDCLLTGADDHVNLEGELPVTGYLFPPIALVAADAVGAIQYMTDNPERYLNPKSHGITINDWDGKVLTYQLQIKASLEQQAGFGQHFVKRNECIKRNLGQID